MTDILLAGDFYLGRGFEPTVDEAVRSRVAAARHSLVNLEAPVTEASERLEKTGPALTMPVTALDHLKKIGFTALAMANNHILDAGLTGLKSTLEAAQDREFMTVGATIVADRYRAAAALCLPLQRGSVTVLNYCEHEWSVRPDGRGACGWNVLDAFADVQKAKRSDGRVLIVLHGGNEYFPLPRPNLRKELRFLAENGADAIAMHHTHVPAAYEVWRGVPIFYGLGNFQFTLPSRRLDWYEGLLVALTFPPGEAVRFEIVPIRQNGRFDLSLANHEQSFETFRQLNGYGIQVASDEALSARWGEFTAGFDLTFAQQLMPTSLLRPRKIRRLAEVVLSRVMLADRKAAKAALNYIRCEAHSEALRTSLQSRFM